MKTTLLAKRTLVGGDYPVLELLFSKPAGFAYAAGQFVSFMIPDGDKVHRRFYSLASHLSDPHLRLIVKLAEGGKASSLFAAMAEGNEIEMEGPFGKFTLPADKSRRVIAIATGTGITPLLSQTKELVLSNPERQYEILWGVRTEEGAFVKKELESLRNELPNFKLHLCVSRPKDGVGRRVTDALAEFIDGRATYLVVGNPDMIVSVQRQLREAGIADANVHVEHFTPGAK